MAEPLEYASSGTVNPRPIGPGYVVLLSLNALAVVGSFLLLVMSVGPSGWGMIATLVRDAQATGASILLAGGSITYAGAHASILTRPQRRILLLSGTGPLILSCASFVMVLLTGDGHGC